MGFVPPEKIYLGGPILAHWPYTGSILFE